MGGDRVPVPPATRDPVAMAALMAALDAGDGATRYIGGWVRDTLLGLAPDDIDCATRLEPEAVVARLKTAGLPHWSTPTMIAHGTVTATAGGHPTEITTLRRDVTTDGRRATVAFTTDWAEDAARRDFTINALSADPLTGAVHDYFDGLGDLAAGLVRFIGDPLTRIAEDHLRLLRFFRFHARFGRGAPDAASYDACVARANDLMALSRERIAGELTKLLAVADPVPAVRLMLEGQVLRPVLPEIDGAGLDRLARLVAREGEAGVAGDPVRRLAALVPADAAAGIARRLKLSKAIEQRLVLAGKGEVAPRPLHTAFEIGGLATADRILLGDGPVADAAAVLDWTRPRLAIGGGDLIARGLTAGPQVAATLKAVERIWVAEDFPGEARQAEIADAAVRAVMERG
ncbi:CCA tRNA nucleotidyltransferase [Sphingomonas naphthae]|uniref:CCA tRNA nucleotidyltransferase n=1 Tax=Sphingomonas naphthae TaxID=1813468 RepID=A0ABY7TH77_9SPHN|nr:CCA tRNA nucleotidyltransferase [Sphingomonas naphthae]WCT72499.1 CCA tRNA nucleotidyltransferase [Sphingomonas naphthae]